MPECSRIISGWTALFVLLGVATACPSRRQGPDTPDLDEKSRATARRLARTQKIREVMTRDLEEFRGLADELHDPPLDLFAGDFPLDLFKHVVVECLNAPATGSADTAEVDGDTGVVAASVDAGGGAEPETNSRDLFCAARFVDELDARLDGRRAEARRRAFELLHKVDRFHELRIRLRRRIAKIEHILANNRNLLASRRAALRKLRARWKQRKPELRAERWRELQDRFDALESDLEQLERETNRLESAAEKWPEIIDRANYRVYFAITSRWKRGE